MKYAVRKIPQSWQITRQRPALIFLGAVTAAAGGHAAGALAGMALSLWQMTHLIRSIGGWLKNSPAGGITPGDVAAAVSTEPEAGTLLASLAGITAALMCGMLVIAVLGALLLRILQGSIIADSTPERQGFTASFNTGWRYAWRMLVIMSIPAVPFTLSLIISVLVIGGYLYISGLAGNPQAMISTLNNSRGLLAGLALFNGLFLLVTLTLSALQPLADRACIFDNQRPVEAFLSGWQLARQSPVKMISILAGQLLIGGAAGVLMLLPGFFSPVLGAVTLPVMWVTNGSLIALFAVIWTLGWHDMVSSGGSD